MEAHMSFSNNEVMDAREAVEKEVGVSLNHDLLYSLVSKVEEKKTGMQFKEALRFSLNELHINDPEKRTLYKKAVGRLFGSHGGKKTARKRKSGLPPKKRQIPTVVGTITEEKGGQFSFKV